MKAHFDGHVIVPDEPVELPVNTPLEVEVVKANGVSPDVDDPAVIAGKLAAFEEYVQRISRRPKGPGIPDEMLRREHIYGDDGR
jgi:hypothetical protein